jgi:hypothetical protein
LDDNPGIDHERALYLVCPADFRFILHHFCEPGSFEGVVGPTLAKNQPKLQQNNTKLIIFPVA